MPDMSASGLCIPDIGSLKSGSSCPSSSPVWTATCCESMDKGVIGAVVKAYSLATVGMAWGLWAMAGAFVALIRAGLRTGSCKATSAVTVPDHQKLAVDGSAHGIHSLLKATWQTMLKCGFFLQSRSDQGLIFSTQRRYKC